MFAALVACASSSPKGRAPTPGFVEDDDRADQVSRSVRIAGRLRGNAAVTAAVEVDGYAAFELADVARGESIQLFASSEALDPVIHVYGPRWSTWGKAHNLAVVDNLSGTYETHELSGSFDGDMLVVVSDFESRGGTIELSVVRTGVGSGMDASVVDAGIDGRVDGALDGGVPGDAMYDAGGGGSVDSGASVDSGRVHEFAVRVDDFTASATLVSADAIDHTRIGNCIATTYREPRSEPTSHVIDVTELTTNVRVDLRNFRTGTWHSVTPAGFSYPGAYFRANGGGALAGNFISHASGPPEIDLRRGTVLTSTSDVFTIRRGSDLVLGITATAGASPTVLARFSHTSLPSRVDCTWTLRGEPLTAVTVDAEVISYVEREELDWLEIASVNSDIQELLPTGWGRVRFEALSTALTGGRLRRVVFVND